MDSHRSSVPSFSLTFPFHHITSAIRGDKPRRCPGKGEEMKMGTKHIPGSDTSWPPPRCCTFSTCTWGGRAASGCPLAPCPVLTRHRHADSRRQRRPEPARRRLRSSSSSSSTDLSPSTSGKWEDREPLLHSSQFLIFQGHIPLLYCLQLSADGGEGVVLFEILSNVPLFFLPYPFSPPLASDLRKNLAVGKGLLGPVCRDSPTIHRVHT